MKELLVDCLLFKTKQLLNEIADNLRDGSRLVVSGILQRADTQNQNGRIYPFDVLQREAKKYEQNFINQQRALGELDHPSCLSAKAKILTKNGWKFIEDISDTEEVLTLNLKTNKPEYQKIIKKIDEPYSGVMYRFKGKNIDVLTTPTHRFVIEDRYGKLMFKTAEELYDLNNSINTHLKIPKSNSCWETESPEHFILNGVDEQTLNKKCKPSLIERYKKDTSIKYDVWMSFIGIYLAEGCTGRTLRDKNKLSKNKGYLVTVSQKDKEKSKKIKDLLSQFPDDLKWTSKPSKGGTTIFSISDARLFNYLYPLGACYDKYIPEDLKNQSASLLECLIEWFHIGDGRDVMYKGYNTKNIFSTSKKLMEDFQEIQLKIGGNGNIIETVDTKDYVYANHLIKAKNKQPLYTLKFNKSKYVHIDNRFLTITKESFDDRVYCVSVPNETFYCKENEKCFWSGNSSVINLKNVSHNIKKLWWEGRDLMGEVEILTTPSGNILRELLRCGITLGVSSRGMGSLKKIDESTNVVEDDFALLAWDFVSDPSVVGAFLKPEGALNESKDNNSIVINPATNKWESVDVIIRDILAEIK